MLRVAWAGRGLGTHGQIRGMEARGAELALGMRSRRGIRDSPGCAAG